VSLSDDRRGTADAAAEPPEDAVRGREDSRDANLRQIRGSNLLLVGRVVGLGLDFVTQVLLVRYLTKDDFGAFALALSIVTIGTTVCLLGLERTLGRFTPIYEEQGDYGRLWGTVITVFVTVISLGLLVILALYLAQGVVGSVVDDRLVMSILLILIVLAPLQALDSLIVAMFATFGSPRSIFVRRYLLAPLLQLGVVVGLMATGGDVLTLAVGYVAAMSFGILLYLGLLVRLLQRRGLLDRLERATFRAPIREVFGFSLPLLATDLVAVLRGAVTVLLLGLFTTTADVAEYRAVLPIAVQMLFVATSFRLIFTPGAARLFARDDATALNDLYWRTAVWIALLTFPVFLVVVANAEPLAVFLFGSPYAGTGVVLMILAIGHYVSGSVGFNSLTLRVFGRVRYLMVGDLLTAGLSVLITVVLIQQFGTLGAAIGTTLSLLIQQTLYQWGLRTRTTVAAADRRYALVYLTIAGATVLTVALTALIQPPLIVGVLLAGSVSALVLWWHGGSLGLLEVYPSLGRIPILRRMLGRGSS
jgi:O-antigen/teichoic acid export membrane protein